MLTVDDLGVFEKPPDLKSPVDDLLVVEELEELGELLDLVVLLDDFGVEKLPDLKLPPELRPPPLLLAYTMV
ncbi:hypothetical protein CLMAG_44730 [Clostridium magnum DSM 2767]|uniref:Uncharacterized protein n=1 Tax=Clostridium magnum DSM 2767 TaxID=1121326 RepID=A0A162RJ82_9CLOT|nr:hypothetical protein CLMAG_44730 [Clostridium magnum DSM 2767]SHI86486.1 hypothetical protein SAMN02745944_04966 [Clostridium magnum DSM 2767]